MDTRSYDPGRYHGQSNGQAVFVYAVFHLHKSGGVSLKGVGIAGKMVNAVRIQFLDTGQKIAVSPK